MTIDATTLVTPKTGADPQLMFDFIDLYRPLVELCGSCSLPPSKAKAAFAAVHQHQSIIFGDPRAGGPQHGTEDAFFADVGCHFRTMFMKFREVALSTDKYNTLRKKASIHTHPQVGPPMNNQLYIHVQ